MDFRFKTKDSLFMEGNTDKGNTIYFVPPREENIQSIIIYNSFEITPI